MSRMSLTRRNLIALGVIAGGATVAGGIAVAAGDPGTETAGKTLTSDLKLPKPFTVPLPIPQPAVPVSNEGDRDHYEFTQHSAKVEIIPGTTTEIWGYDGTFPGPTLQLRRGRPVTLTVKNRLPVPTSTHLHGGVTPADSDGFPTDLVVPEGDGGRFVPGKGSHMAIDESVWSLHDGSRDYEYPVDQPAATLWYHDHRMDFTAPQVWRGLAGLCIVGDEVDDDLPLPKGDRDIPLLICDRAFREDGSFKYPSVDGTLFGEPGVTGDFHQGVQGDTILVNGAPWPTLEVAATKYRLRILNASNARRYRIALDPAPGKTAGFTQIAADQGLLAQPIPVETLTLAPAERREVIIDFGRFKPGTKVTLTNTLDEGDTGKIMRFVVGKRAVDDTSIPDTLADPQTLSVNEVVGDRRFRFEARDHMWTINGRSYDPADSIASIGLDTVERWTLSSDFHHPVHIHLGHFQVLSRNGKPPSDDDAGRKDTVDLRPFEVVEVLVKFTGHKGRYMMHCHNLEHEDMAMMANFDVV